MIFTFFFLILFFQIDSDNYKIKQTRLAYKHGIKIMILVCLFDFYWFLPVCLMNLKIKQNVMILWKKVQKKSVQLFLKRVNAISENLRYRKTSTNVPVLCLPCGWIIWGAWMWFQTLFDAFTVQLEELQPPVQMRQVKWGRRGGVVEVTKYINDEYLIIYHPNVQISRSFTID